MCTTPCVFGCDLVYSGITIFPIFCLFFSYFLDFGIFLFCRWPRLLQLSIFDAISAWIYLSTPCISEAAIATNNTFADTLSPQSILCAPNPRKCALHEKLASASCRPPSLRNALSTAGNSMTSSERPSTEPRLKKKLPEPHWGGGYFWKCSGSLKCL